MTKATAQTQTTGRPLGAMPIVNFVQLSIYWCCAPCPQLTSGGASKRGYGTTMSQKTP